MYLRRIMIAMGGTLLIAACQDTAMSSFEESYADGLRPQIRQQLVELNQFSETEIDQALDSQSRKAAKCVVEMLGVYPSAYQELVYQKFAAGSDALESIATMDALLESEFDSGALSIEQVKDYVEKARATTIECMS